MKSWKGGNPWNKKVVGNFKEWQMAIISVFLTISLVVGIVIVMTMPHLLAFREMLIEKGILYDAIFILFLLVLFLGLYKLSNGSSDSINSNGAHSKPD
jgi:hypothetical protein